MVLPTPGVPENNMFDISPLSIKDWNNVKCLIQAVLRIEQAERGKDAESEVDETLSGETYQQHYTEYCAELLHMLRLRAEYRLAKNAAAKATLGSRIANAKGIAL